MNVCNTEMYDELWAVYPGVKCLQSIASRMILGQKARLSEQEPLQFSQNRNNKEANLLCCKIIR